MSRVLVTGATTPVGRHLVELLLADPQTRRVLAVAAERPEDAIPVTDDRLSYVQCDLTRPREIWRLLFGPGRELEVDTLVHAPLHARARVGGRRARALNVESTRALLHLADRHPSLHHFVYRSTADVYGLSGDQPVIVDEEHPLRLTPWMPQYLRDRVEADVTVCTRMGLAPYSVTVLRCAEILAPRSGSQLYDYLSSRVCFRPLGYDPMMHVMTVEDAARALLQAVHTRPRGVFNIPGKDILPLSQAIERTQRIGLAVPGPALAPLYGLRAAALRTDFRYDLNQLRFHFSGVLDGRRARVELGYEPTVGVDWSTLAATALL